MPLFTNHETMQIDARCVRCPEPECPRFLPAPRECQHGRNRGKWYTVCYNESHGQRFKFWESGAFASSPAAQVNTPPAQNNISPAAHPSSKHPRPARTPSAKCSSCSRPGNAQCQRRRCKTCCREQPSSFCSVHEIAPLARALSDTTQQLLVTGLEEAAAAVPAPRRRLNELHHQRLAQEQEAAARLAALTPLPPSPTLSQEARDQAFAVSVALGSSPPPLIMSQPTRRVTLVSWAHSTEASTITVQDLPGWAQTWPTIRLADFAPFLTSRIHPRPDTYYDYWNFRLGQWVGIPQAYTFQVVTDEPILLRRSGMAANDQDDLITSFTRFVDRFIYRVEFPAALSLKRQRATTPPSLKRQRATTPPSRRPSKKIKREVADSSDDELEISEVRRMVKLEPRTPRTSRLGSAPGPPFVSSRLSFHITSPIASGSRWSLSPPPIASTSCLPSLSQRRASSSSPFPSTPSLYNSTFTTSSSSSSLSSPGSSLSNPVHFLEDK
ncbi:hypothetical protein B0H14DRAFT_2689043 [Mycena olivaceomarginata]|nr:hypothetical protein B0H14DRAFT_2689043 [Mycena olivaceomarginata]